jgi:hypothetical protein
MSQPQQSPAPLTRALARTRVSVLVALACFAIFAATQEGSDSAPLGRTATATALALALGSIAARHLSGSRSRPARRAVGFALAGMLLALAVGALGVVISSTQGARETGILLAFGGFILAIPRPRIAALVTAGSDPELASRS